MKQTTIETCLYGNLQTNLCVHPWSTTLLSVGIEGGGTHTDIALIIEKGATKGNMHLKASSTTRLSPK